MVDNKMVNFLINIAYYFIISIIIYISIKFLFAYLFPLIIGTVITIVVQKPASTISNKLKIRKGYCALALVIVVYLLLVVVLSLLVFKTGSYIYRFTTSDKQILAGISSKFESIVNELNQITGEQFSSVVKSFFNSILGIITNFAKTAIKITPKLLTSSIVTIIASCYIATDYDRFKASILSVLPSKYIYLCSEIKILFREKVLRIIIGYAKITAITFFELLIGLIFFKVNNFIIVAALISILDLLPIFGTGTVLIPWGVYAIITGNYYLGAGLIILYAIIVIIRNIIEPKIIGKQIGIHPLIALILVFVGLKLFGFIGIFVLPFTVMIIYNLFEKGILTKFLNYNN